MKNKITLLIAVFNLGYMTSYSQILVGFQYNMDVYKPYTEDTQEYMKINDKITSSTRSFYGLYGFSHKQVIWRTGLSFKQIFHTTEDKVTSYYRNNYNTGQIEQIQKVLDLKSRSFSIGLKNEIGYFLTKSERMKNELGLTTELYLWEKYISRYYYDSTDEEFDDNNVTIFALSSGKSGLFLSSFNLAAYYRFQWQPIDQFSIATRFSFGTNLYSDWDQFQKYAWVGLGLEVGFGGE